MHIVPGNQRPDLKQRCAHRNPKRLGLIGSGNDTTIIVGEYDNRLTIQVRPKQSFT